MKEGIGGRFSGDAAFDDGEACGDAGALLAVEIAADGCGKADMAEAVDFFGFGIMERGKGFGGRDGDESAAGGEALQGGADVAEIDAGD